MSYTLCVLVLIDLFISHNFDALISEKRLVVVCGCCFKEIGRTMFLDNEDIEISYNTVPIPREVSLSGVPLLLQ